MAWIVERPNGFLVRWRDSDRRTRSKLVRDPADAAALKARIESEDRARKVLAGVSGIPGWDGPGTIGPTLDEDYAFERVARRLVEQDSELRDSARDRYLNVLRNHIEGTAMGRADIRTVGPDDVRTFWAGVATNRRNAFQLVTKTFNGAVREGVIDVSPMVRANLKSPTRRIRPEDRVLTVDELERLADGTRDPRGRMAVLLMGYCGLRAGEVGGLRVQDVNRGRLSIRQAVAQTDKVRYLSPPKTDAARRTVAMPPSVASELNAYIETNQPADDGRIFHRGSGELWPNQAINHQVQKAAKRAGLPPVHSHQLRHTAVSLLIDDGANPKAIQVFVGHARIDETLGTYGHLFDHGGDALAASMERRRAEHRGA